MATENFKRKSLALCAAEPNKSYLLGQDAVDAVKLMIGQLQRTFGLVWQS